MLTEITGRNVPEAYDEAKWKMKIEGVMEDSRNGKVMSIPHPVLLTIKNPYERVLFDPVRDCNPFFHVMEFVWMMSGSNNAYWISRFNKRMTEYADDGYLRGAYGWRWLNPKDQITQIIDLLRKEPETRQAVLSMWDPVYDGPEARTSDRPCNTHIYFRVTKSDDLEMTVCNRSNDLIWGMLGANAVHMTLLHELIARAAGYYQGAYRVFTNNLHTYPGMPRFHEIFTPQVKYDYYPMREFPILRPEENFMQFRHDCKLLVAGDSLEKVETWWVRNVAVPMYHAYLDKNTRTRELIIKSILADDWRKNCEEWLKRRTSN